MGAKTLKKASPEEWGVLLQQAIASAYGFRI